MDILVSRDGVLRWGECSVRCALGRSGIRFDKREGDGATPAGNYPLRMVYFRADRLAPPATGLAITTITADAGWCDDPVDPQYNRPVRLPYAGRHERLWRDDHLYDLLAVIGYNDQPVRPERGSAIFLHVAHTDYAPTEGCVALALADLCRLLRDCASGDRVLIGD
jgi:L,D-peptidoglycan transpeptidase YkuD (ErfK/YbiS/YcfS/YnhG family)